eukprot:587638-Pyramimonas_sp.AAC.1
MFPLSALGREGRGGGPAFQAEAITEQNVKLTAEKEAGAKQRKLKKHAKFGNDDCGGHVEGLGLDASATRLKRGCVH